MNISTQAVEKKGYFNLPNALTWLRIVMIPAIVVLFYLPVWWSGPAACAGFAIAGITDTLDGYYARKMGLTSRLGEFLDPVADKLIVLGGLAVLADRGVFPWWPVLLIAGREFGISLYRSVAGRRGVVLPAQRLGKYKAFTQYCAVGFVLLPWTADAVGFQRLVLAVAVLLTVVSGLQIVRRGYTDWQRQDT
jgi:CDP-diacylglycerol--glycerol-3-phosphate 3-phosphatidyltransferase